MLLRKYHVLFHHHLWMFSVHLTLENSVQILLQSRSSLFQKLRTRHHRVYDCDWSEDIYKSYILIGYSLIKLKAVGR